MLFRVDPLAPEPIFEQLVFQVKGAVARGEILTGEKLPSVRELAREAAINPNTVVRAYEALERDGVIVRRQGAGCFVTGRTSDLRDEAKERQLESLAERTVTEAYHLGFKAQDVRKAFERALDHVHFPRERGRKRRPQK